jgi:NAD(P)-dependent dehydrogenase (short-subunit alcohol dehydrogenase family)
MRFEGKTILVTGASSGIGEATARLLDREGAAELILVDKTSRAGQFSLTCGMRVFVNDVADPEFWSSRDFSQIDHAVINAGVAGAGLVADLGFQEWRRILSVNLDGAFLSLQAALRAIRDGGSIVTVASAAGLKPEPGVSA